jgi:thioredoxin reductase
LESDNKKNNFDSVYDCVIVGGGPAGLTCAIFLGRYRRRVAVIHNGKPRNYASRGIHGFLGQHGIAPQVLIEKGCEEARAFGVEIFEATAGRVEKVGDHFEVTTSVGTLRARRVVLAYGVRDCLPDIPGLKQFYGTGVFHCPDCDGYEASGKRIGVISSGRAAAGLSLKMLQWSDDVTVFFHGSDRGIAPDEVSKLHAEGIRIKDEKVLELVGNGETLEALVLDSGERVPIDAVFFSTGVERSCILAEDVGCEVMEDTPNVVVNDVRQTTVEGIYAIGDLVPGSQLAITAAADGALAAIAINKTLLPPAWQV